MLLFHVSASRTMVASCVACSGRFPHIPGIHPILALAPASITPRYASPRETNGWQVDFLPVLKHRDSGIVVVPVVRVSLTVASSRRGEMESYTVSARV